MKYLYYYLAVINVFALVLYGIDKLKAIRRKWRIPEKVLIGVSVIGGAAGAILGMTVFHHKTRKKKFTILVPLTLIIWVVVLFLLNLK